MLSVGKTIKQKTQVIDFIQHYNLDMIISVGYRIKSKRGTQFRIWATNTLRDHLIQGYTLNEKRLQSRGVEIEQALALLSSTLRNQHPITDQGQAVLDVVQRYTRSWRLLREYDEDQLSAAPEQASAPVAELDIATARIAIRSIPPLSRERHTFSTRHRRAAFFRHRPDLIIRLVLNLLVEDRG